MDIRFALVTLILPALMEISGLIMMLHPPKTRNVLFGYRTKRSLLSQETWDFANYYGGTLYVYLGFYIIAVTLMTDIILKITGAGRSIAATAAIVLVLVQALSFIFPVFFVEAKLRSEFDAEGNPLNSLSGRDLASSCDNSDWDDWDRDEWKDAWRDEYNDWDLWKKKRDAEIAEEKRAAAAERSAEASENGEEFGKKEEKAEREDEK